MLYEVNFKLELSTDFIEFFQGFFLGNIYRYTHLEYNPEFKKISYLNLLSVEIQMQKIYSVNEIKEKRKKGIALLEQQTKSSLKEMLNDLIDSIDSTDLPE
jgi:hypothetical protein